MDFLKAHGTQNDFVVLPDPDGELDLTPARVAALCDRRGGIGADGVLRVVRGGALGEPLPDGVAEDGWFMDYRNADGSVAEMCGNGVRVFAHLVLALGLGTDTAFVVGSRAGARPVVVHRHDGSTADVSVDMGPARSGGRASVDLAGRSWSGEVLDLGNPHLAVVDASLEADLAGLDLTGHPVLDPAVFPRGANVELVTPLVAGAVTVRVHERGVGETRSCGTGTVAAVVAALHAAGESTGSVAVRTPGGSLQVAVDERTTVLRGPATVVARGRLDPVWWSSH
ncbi:diaminopimelate epimerase [Rhodococcus aerolatus]